MTASSATDETRRGLLATFTAFVIWGCMPAYLRPLIDVDPFQIAASRLVFGCLCVLGWLALRGALAPVRAALADGRMRLRLFATAACISINWLVFAWGVTHGQVVESSLGYFINPLVNVLLGVLLLRERLNRVQWTAVALAALGVLYLTWEGGRPPWIALVLATSFGVYGLLRKVLAVEALPGLAAETLLIAPLGVAYLVWVELHGTGAIGHQGALVTALLIGGGPYTAIPLALFAFGARRLPYSTVGIVQYVGPTLQLLLGLFLYREPLPMARLYGFALIWLALALYGFDGLRRARAANA